jgi:hypothetical protein
MSASASNLIPLDILNRNLNAANDLLERARQNLYNVGSVNTTLVLDSLNTLGDANLSSSTVRPPATDTAQQNTQRTNESNFDIGETGSRSLLTLMNDWAKQQEQPRYTQAESTHSPLVPQRNASPLISLLEEPSNTAELSLSEKQDGGNKQSQTSLARPNELSELPDIDLTPQLEQPRSYPQPQQAGSETRANPWHQSPSHPQTIVNSGQYSDEIIQPMPPNAQLQSKMEPGPLVSTAIARFRNKLDHAEAYILPRKSFTAATDLESDVSEEDSKVNPIAGTGVASTLAKEESLPAASPNFHVPSKQSASRKKPERVTFALSTSDNAENAVETPNTNQTTDAVESANVRTQGANPEPVKDGFEMKKLSDIATNKLDSSLQTVHEV